jgi:hypothetical protein
MRPTEQAADGSSWVARGCALKRGMTERDENRYPKIENPRSLLSVAEAASMRPSRRLASTGSASTSPKL